MRVLITGGAGYVGSQLVPSLLSDGHDVVVYDTFWFGDHLPGVEQRSRMLPKGDENNVVSWWDAPNGNFLLLCVGDIRDTVAFRAAVTDCDAVIHLACLSNDPSAEIDADFTRAVNLDAFAPLVQVCQEAGVRRFINCSTSSVYGISDAPDVREDHPLVPLTLYNTFKAQCEEVLRQQYPDGGGDDFEWVTIRPSTVCGYSPRQRLDLAVNILTNQAYHLGKITVLGGTQRRPNIHIDDMVDAYRNLLAAPSDKIRGQTFNVGAGNMSIAALAAIVRGTVMAWRFGHSVEIETRSSVDPRSYQVNSQKIADVLGFTCQHTVGEAVADLCTAFDQGLLPGAVGPSGHPADEYVNVRQMRRLFPDIYRGAPEPVLAQGGVLSEIDVIRGAGR